MEELFSQFCEHLSANPWLQSVLIIFGSCFVEDPARCIVSMLVATGELGWLFAFGNMVVGAMAGDIGLYLIGRDASMFIIKRRWFDHLQLQSMKSYYRNHAAKTVLLARFLPGARMLTFSVAGVIRYSFGRFAFWTFCAAVIQAAIFLKFGEMIPDNVIRIMKNPRFSAVVFLLTFGVMYAACHLFSKRKRPIRPLQHEGNEQNGTKEQANDSRSSE